MIRRGTLIRGLIASATLALCSPADGQLLAPVQAPKEAAQMEATKSPVVSDSTARLAEVRATLARLERPNAVAEGSPPGTPDAEIGDRMRLLHQLERSLAQQLDGQERYAHVVDARRNAEARADNWRGFVDPPPYSLAFADGLAQTQETLVQQVATIESRETVLNGLMQRLQRRLRDSEAELRLATERLEGASADTEQRRRAKWLRDLAQLRSEEIAAALDEVQQGHTNAAEEKGAAQANLRLTKAQLAIARSATRFTKDDLDRIDARLAGESKALSGELDQQTAVWRERQRESDDAIKRLADSRKAGALPAEPPEAYAARIAALDRDADIAQRRP